MTEFENQILWVTVIGESGATYYITSDKLRTAYTLWKNKGAKIALTKYQSANPLELYGYCK